NTWGSPGVNVEYQPTALSQIQAAIAERYVTCRSIPLSRWVIPDNPLGDAARLIRVLALDRHLPGDLHAAGGILDRHRHKARPDPGTRRDRRDEPHPVHAVVDRHAQAVERHRVADERAQERQRQEAVG